MAAEIRRPPAFLRLDPVLGWGGVLAGVVEDPRDGALRLAPMGGRRRCRWPMRRAVSAG